MKIIRGEDGKYRIVHQGKIVTGCEHSDASKADGFDSERAAEEWADDWIDDQVFDGDNTLCPPLTYRLQRSGA